MQPVSTYRLQLTKDFDLDQAAATVPYLARLGVTHLYCSPWLESEHDSAHGYDVVDHSRVDRQLGGAEALARLSAACREAGLGIVLDIVPNHMSVATPSANAAWWSVLRDGKASRYAGWFDVDWSQDQIVLPVLAGPLADCLDDLVVEGDTLRYHQQVYPLSPGTAVAGDLEVTLAAQHYRLTDWRDGQLGYRRFFDVTSLAGLRVEDEPVLAATHALVLEQVRSGVVDGLRVDHPDGLADPAAYLQRLAELVPGTWTVVEKILEPGEQLPAWPCAGTTGYDAVQQVTGLFVDPAGEAELTALWAGPSFEQTAAESKRLVLTHNLTAEVRRLVDLAVPVLQADEDRVGQALRELLVAFDLYRAYLPATGPADERARSTVTAAVHRAQAARPDLTGVLAELGQLALAETPCPEFVTRFQQTCGPVMAKGIEDTAFYRHARLLALNEVGGDPSVFGVSAEAFHAYCQGRLRDWPLTLTALSTHDTKRSEDVRARLVLLSHDPARWTRATRDWSAQMSARLDHPSELLVWQTLLGAWPIETERAVAYAVKAAREAKTRTSWVDPDSSYEQELTAFVEEAVAARAADLADYVESLRPAWRSTVLAQKLVQLTMPGVADCYQGTEAVSLSLVDPDNRRPVDYDYRRALLDNDGTGLDAEKQRLVATALALRREQPAWFLHGSYEPVDAPADVLAFCRADRVLTAVPLRGGAVGTLALPEGDWVDLLPQLPVSLWVRA